CRPSCTTGRASTGRTAASGCTRIPTARGNTSTPNPFFPRRSPRGRAISNGPYSSCRQAGTRDTSASGWARSSASRPRSARCPTTVMTQTPHAIDIVIVATYLAALAGVGVFFSRRQLNLNDFFLGRQSMAWLPVGLSLMAALNSGIDYLMQPSSTIKYGLILLVGTSSWLVLYPWVAYVTAPFYRRLQVYTAYEYLEARFAVRVRTLAAAIFVVWRLGWMATAIYVPCLAISAATGGTIPLVPTIIVLGAVVTLYAALGGVQAVIWNDVVQFCVRFGGLAAVVWIATASVPGGVGAIWRVAHDAGKTDLIAPIASAPGG